MTIRRWEVAELFDIFGIHPFHATPVTALRLDSPPRSPSPGT
jgi:hypothetical protein